MKLFQQLLIAPAALGLLAPVAANAAEVNIKGVAGYASYEETYQPEVSAAQFSDVIPGDWAYTALQNLSESYGCVDNAYSQNLRSGQSLTRFEAAALVNACLEGGIASADVDSDTLRLTNEFGTEMAILKGRIDGLEYKVKELSAGQFSSATKMSGQASFQVGTVTSDDATHTASGFGTTGVTDDGKLFSTYEYKLDLNTSFNGTDLLTVGLEAGNNGNNPNTQLDSAGGWATANVLTVTSLFYNFPVGDDFSVTAGPLLDQDDVISATTSVYSDAFRLASMPWGAAAQTGAGAAIEYVNDSGFNASLSSISVGGNSATTGIWSNETADVVTFAVGYDGDNFGGGLIYTRPDNGTGVGGTTLVESDTSFGGGVYFTPDNFPTISISYDTYSDANANDMSDWMIGLDHPIGPGTASVAYQSRDQGGASTGTADRTTSNYELYYNYPVTDGIEIQGGVFVEEDLTVNRDSTIGYMVETFFKF
jgi:hypothetical protein